MTWLETDFSALFQLVCPPPSVTTIFTVDEESKETSLRWTIVDVQDEGLFKLLYPLHAKIDRRTGVKTLKSTQIDKPKVHPPATPIEVSLPVATPAPGISRESARFLGFAFVCLIPSH